MSATTRLKFTATVTMQMYYDGPLLTSSGSRHWHDGDEKDVEAERAKELVKSFPNNFAPVTERKAVKDADNKGIFTGKVKKKK